MKNLILAGYRFVRPSRKQRPKVIGIGLSRTGTKSLNAALRILGLRSDHFSTHLIALRGGELQMDFKKAALYDGLTDITATRFYRELDRYFPGAKFVLTIRDRVQWLASCERHFPPLVPGRWPSNSSKVRQLRTDIYGAECFEAQKFSQAYAAHVTNALRYFDHRPADLLVLDISTIDAWSRLCSFLGQPEPKRPFPWKNNSRVSRVG